MATNLTTDNRKTRADFAAATGLAGTDELAGWQGTTALKRFSLTALDGFLFSDREAVGVQTNRIFRRKLAKTLALKFGDYASLITSYSYDYLYPQAMALDEVGNRLFVVFSPGTGSNAWNWVAVYNWTTGAYISCFAAGEGVGEGAEIVYDGSTRYLYVRNDTNEIGRFDITALPTNATQATAADTYTVDYYISFCREPAGTWLVEQRSTPLGQSIRRHIFNRYSADFSTRLGMIDLGALETGVSNVAGTSDESDQIPKRQGIAAGKGHIFAMYGANYLDTGTPLPIEYTGIKVFDMAGRKVAEGLADPEQGMEILDDASIACTHLEAEDCVVAADGTVYSLYVTLSPTTDAGSTSDGLLIFEEFSPDADALDFTPAAAARPGPDLTRYAQMAVKGTEELYNPITGDEFTTMEQILDFMAAVDLPTFRFYTTSVAFNDISGAAIPTATMVEITNANNSTFFMTLMSSTIWERYLIVGSPGSRTQTKRYPAITGTGKLALSSTSLAGGVHAHSAVASATLTGSTSETTLATITIPAGAVGANGFVDIETQWSYTNSGNAKTMRIRAGGVSGTQYLNIAPTTTSLMRRRTRIANVNSQSSQKGWGNNASADYGTTTATQVTSSVDTSAAWDIVISGQLADAGEQIILQSYSVEIFYRD